MGPPHVIPDMVTEKWRLQSFNAEIPGDVIQPGVELIVHMDPDGVVPLRPGSEPRVPAEGTLALNVVELPVHYQTLVPVIAETDPREQIRIWAQDMTVESEWLRFARSVLPIGEMHLTMHDPFYTSVDLGTFQGWLQLIGDIQALRTMENGRGYYYGAFHRANLTGIVGLGRIGFPVSIGLSQDDTFAHEVGHNMSLRHAPCGGAGGPDPRFPYRDGSTGVWGYNPAGGGIIDPDQFKDLMGYCDPSWVSDYSFEKALNFRIRTEIGRGGSDSVDRRPVEQTLMLRGRAVMVN